MDSDGMDRMLRQERVPMISEADRWSRIDSCPHSGDAFLLYGVHNTDNGRSWRVGDDWVAIGLWDIWREPQNWVFSKDGMPMWNEPLLWREVPFDSAREALAAQQR